MGGLTAIMYKVPPVMVAMVVMKGVGKSRGPQAEMGTPRFVNKVLNASDDTFASVSTSRFRGVQTVFCSLVFEQDMSLMCESSMRRPDRVWRRQIALVELIMPHEHTPR